MTNELNSRDECLAAACRGPERSGNGLVLLNVVFRVPLRKTQQDLGDS